MAFWLVFKDFQFVEAVCFERKNSLYSYLLAYFTLAEIKLNTKSIRDKDKRLTP